MCKGTTFGQRWPMFLRSKGKTRAWDGWSFWAVLPLQSIFLMTQVGAWRRYRRKYLWTILYWRFFSLLYSSKVSEERCRPLPHHSKVCSTLLEPSDLTWLETSWAGGKSCCHLQVSFPAHSPNRKLWANLSMFRDSWRPTGPAEQQKLSTVDEDLLSFKDLYIGLKDITEYQVGGDTTTDCEPGWFRLDWVH